MLTIHKETDAQGAAILRLEGEASVETAAQLQSALIEGLQQHEALKINCDQLGGIDFFTIQLLCSAHRTSVAWQKLFSFDGEPAAVVADAVRLTGFARHRGCARCPEDVRCMWT